MEKEFIKETKHSVTVNVTGGKIDSYREIERTTGTLRLYENGYIGVVGCLGEPDEETLTQQAKDALAFKIPYPCRLEGPVTMELAPTEEIVPVAEFIPTMQRFLDLLGEQCPKFAFFNKISLEYSRREYRNSAGRHLVSEANACNITLFAQNRGSGNMIDTLLFWSGDRFAQENILQAFKQEYDAFFRTAEIAPGRWPVVIDPSMILYRYGQHVSADRYAAGVSLLSGKLGQRIFSKKLTIRDDMDPSTNPGACRFDAEGCVAADYRPTVVEQGVLKGLIGTKRSSAQHGLPNLGNADASYNSVPEAGLHRIWLDPTAKTLKELVPGKCVYVAITDGGNATPDGHFAAPVQLAYLMENGRFVGRLPELTISGEFFELFGQDYLGTVHNDPVDGRILSAFQMEVSVGN